MFSRSGSNGSHSISELDDLISTYDIIFLILPLTAESKHLFNRTRLFAMKKGAALINVARGGVVDTDALVEVLNAEHITAGVDVTDPEPLPDGHPLWSAKNIIITPHVGGDTTAFGPRGKKLIEDQIARWAKGDELINVVAE